MQKSYAYVHRKEKRKKWHSFSVFRAPLLDTLASQQTTKRGAKVVYLFICGVAWIELWRDIGLPWQATLGMERTWRRRTSCRRTPAFCSIMMIKSLAMPANMTRMFSVLKMYNIVAINVIFYNMISPAVCFTVLFRCFSSTKKGSFFCNSVLHPKSLFRMYGRIRAAATLCMDILQVKWMTPLQWHRELSPVWSMLLFASSSMS